MKTVLLTADKDFGELVYQKRRLHSGILLYRLHGLAIEEKILLIVTVIDMYELELLCSFTVITPRSTKIRKQKP